MKKKETVVEKEKHPVSIRPLLHNGPYLFFIVLIGLASGVGNIGHTYIPELLMDSGLPVHICLYGCSYLRRSGSSLDLFL